jgi:hypothetical protein
VRVKDRLLEYTEFVRVKREGVPVESESVGLCLIPAC